MSAVIADKLDGDPIGPAGGDFDRMEDVKRLSEFVQINADRSCRDRQVPGMQRLSHLRNGSRGLVADRRLERRCRFIRSSCRQCGKSHKNAERGSLNDIPQHCSRSTRGCAIDRAVRSHRRSPGLGEGPPQTITDFHVHFL
ncbi:hypothetical protein ACVITL_006697 [Rhizobium pisi]